MSLLSKLFGWMKPNKSTENAEQSIRESVTTVNDVDRDADTIDLTPVNKVIHITKRNDGIRVEWSVPADNGGGYLKSARIPTVYSVSDVMSYINAGYRPNSYQLWFVVNSIQHGINNVQSLLNQLVTDGFMRCDNGVYWLTTNTSLSDIRWEDYTYPR